MMAVAGLFQLISILFLILIFFSVPQEKFVEYVTTSDEYKNNFDRALV